MPPVAKPRQEAEQQDQPVDKIDPKGKQVARQPPIIEGVLIAGDGLRTARNRWSVQAPGFTGIGGNRG